MIPQVRAPSFDLSLCLIFCVCRWKEKLQSCSFMLMTQWCTSLAFWAPTWACFSLKHDHVSLHFEWETTKMISSYKYYIYMYMWTIDSQPRAHCISWTLPTTVRQFRTNSLYTSWNDWITGLYLCIQVQRSNRNYEWKGNLKHFGSPGGFLALISVCTCALLILLLGLATIYPPSLVPLDHFIANLTDHLTEKCTSELAWFDFFFFLLCLKPVVVIAFLLQLVWCII